MFIFYMVRRRRHQELIYIQSVWIILGAILLIFPWIFLKNSLDVVKISSSILGVILIVLALLIKRKK